MEEVIVSGEGSWKASYALEGEDNVLIATIFARGSKIVVVVARAFGLYYISVPGEGAAIPGIDNLDDSFWIWERLAGCGMAVPDAQSVAAVLRNIGEF